MQAGNQSGSDFLNQPELPVFLMIEATPDPQQQEALQAYISQAAPIGERHGGVPVATYTVDTPLDNQQSAGLFAVVSFPDKRAIDNMFADPDYHALIPQRNQAFSHLRYYVVNEKL